MSHPRSRRTRRRDRPTQPARHRATLVVLAFILAGCGVFASPGTDEVVAPVTQPAPEGELTERERIDKVRRDATGLVPLLNEFWTRELDELYGFVFEPPHSVFSTVGDAELECGDELFSNEANAVYCWAPGATYVAYDLDWFEQYLVTYPGGATTFLVLAHEWGHAVQVPFEVDGGDTWSPEHRRELGADCLAGVFISRSLDEGLLLEDEDDMDAIFAWLSEQSGPWFEPTSHGTPAQRVAAFTDGYSTGDTDDCRWRY